MKTRLPSLLNRRRFPLGTLALAALFSCGQAQTPNTPSQLVNLSVRQTLAAGDSLTVGFVVRGNSPARLLVRGAGPSLASFGVTDAMRNPKIALTSVSASNNTVSVHNDDWSNAPLQGSTDRIKTLPTVMEAGFPFAAGSLDSALLVELQPGPYTMTVSGSSPTESGTVLAEIYDTKPSAITGGGHLINLSALGKVTAASPLLAGFVVIGDPMLGASERLLLRVGGPALADFGVPNTLPDPRLDLVTPPGKNLGNNDNWTGEESFIDGRAVRMAVLNTGASPYKTGSRDAAAVVQIPPGTYTLVGRDTTGASGTALIEIFEWVSNPNDLFPNPPFD